MLSHVIDYDVMIWYGMFMIIILYMDRAVRSSALLCYLQIGSYVPRHLVDVSSYDMFDFPYIRDRNIFQKKAKHFGILINLFVFQTPYV